MVPIVVHQPDFHRGKLGGASVRCLVKDWFGSLIPFIINHRTQQASRLLLRVHIKEFSTWPMWQSWQPMR